ncbi:unnamed protein product, partial [marine sediment metagenome]
MKQRARVDGKGLVILGASVLLGLTLLVSGSGKLPGQTEFIDVLLQSLWTPPVAYFVGYCLPWVEIILEVLLLV